MRVPLGPWLLVSAVIAATLDLSIVGAQPARPKATLVPLVETEGVHPGSQVRLALRVTLPDGIHVQSDKPRDAALIPTVLTAGAAQGITLGDVVYPEPTDFAQSGQTQPLAVFEHDFLVGVTIRVAPDLPAGDVALPARLRFQACDAHTCFIPTREEFSWTLRVVPKTTAIPARHPELFQRIRFAPRT